MGNICLCNKYSNTCLGLPKLYNKYRIKLFLKGVSRGEKVDENYGHLEIRLNELLKSKGLSKNKLSHKAEMNWKQIDNYCTNNITRLDVFVLCKLCTVLECTIEDLLVFHPPEKR